MASPDLTNITYNADGYVVIEPSQQSRPDDIQFEDPLRHHTRKKQRKVKLDDSMNPGLGAPIDDRRRRLHGKISYVELRPHVLEETIYTCPICEFTAESERRIVRHINSIHVLKETFYTCRICDFTCRGKHGIVRHVNDYHQTELKNVKDIMCHVCGSFFPSMWHLNRHVNDEHVHVNDGQGCALWVTLRNLDNKNVD